MPNAIHQSEAAGDSPGRKPWPVFASLLIFALLVRGGALAAMWNQLHDDPDGYRAIAENVLRHGVYGRQLHGNDLLPTAYRPPLYPLVLAKIGSGGSVAPTAVAALHLLLGVATILLVYWLAQQWQLGPCSALAAVLVACDPILLHQSTLVMTETTATFLAVVGLICLTRHTQRRCWWTAGLAGGVLALAVLCRPVFVAALALSAVVVAVVAPNWPRRLANSAALLLAAALVLAPWGIRNYRIFGRPIVTTTHGGYTLALGNNRFFYQYLRSGDGPAPWDAEQFKADLRTSGPDLQLTEPDWDRWVFEKSLRLIRSQPGTFVYSCLYRLGQLWGVMPHASYRQESDARRLLRWGVGGWYALLFFAAGVGAFQLGGRLLRAPWLWGTLFCLSFTAVHTLFWANLRMRAPLMPFVCMLAAVGVARLVAVMRRRK